MVNYSYLRLSVLLKNNFKGFETGNVKFVCLTLRGKSETGKLKGPLALEGWR